MHLSNTHLRKISFVLLLGGLSLFLYFRHREIENKGSLRWFDRSLVFLTAPLSRGVVFLNERIRRIVEDYFLLVGVSRENRRLKKEAEEAKVREMFCREEERENERLRGLVVLKERLADRWIGVAARVISYSPVAPYRIITIDKGRNEGLERRAPVISPDGLVGQVARVLGDTSEVLLITDPTSAVDAVIEEEGGKWVGRGLVVGRTIKLDLRRELFLGVFEYLGRSPAVEEGMSVLTSGLDGIYPPGMSIGSIRLKKGAREQLFEQAEAIPSVDFYKIKEVLVLKKRERS